MTSSLSERPLLSVVVIAVYRSEHLERCLTALAKQMNPPEMEIIAVYHGGTGDISFLRERFPTVRFYCATGLLTQAKMLALGIGQAHGDIVALTVDHCSPANDWCARIVEAHTRPCAAVGGALEKGEQADTAVNWAVHLDDYCSYGYYQNPVRRGPARELSDCNVSYKRKTLAAIADAWSNGFHVPLVNRALLASGETLWFSPELLVYQHRSIECQRAARVAFRRGRAFASARLVKFSRLKRMTYTLLCPFLPLKQISKLLVNTLPKGKHLNAVIRALPFVLLFSASWALGEFIGLVLGQLSYTITVAEE